MEEIWDDTVGVVVYNGDLVPTTRGIVHVVGTNVLHALPIVDDAGVFKLDVFWRLKPYLLYVWQSLQE